MLEPLHTFHTALLLEPCEHEAEDVDIPARRRVVHRVLVDHTLIAVHDRRDRQLMSGKRTVNDRDREPRGCHVLLRTGKDHAVLRHVHRARENVGRHIARERHAAGLGHILPFRTVDGVIGAIVKVRSTGRELQLALLRDAGVTAGGGICRDVHRAVLLGFFCRASGKVPGHGVIRRAVRPHQIKRDHRKLRRSAALQKQDRMCVRDGQCAAKARLHFLKDIGKGLTSVTHLHHGHTRPVIIEQFCLCLLKHFLRQH